MPSPAVPAHAVPAARILTAHTPLWGSILVDVETHQLIDVLPDRTSETLASWLRELPVSRSCAGSLTVGTDGRLTLVPCSCPRW
ncbi:hypothetical protein AV521_43650 [Streptomyces sp. IMTB 2501]|nr:hypothetical protein AV521_43650 [Streptomyces sp. IMTB 2501]